MITDGGQGCFKTQKLLTPSICGSVNIATLELSTAVFRTLAEWRLDDVTVTSVWTLRTLKRFKRFNVLSVQTDIRMSHLRET